MFQAPVADEAMRRPEPPFAELRRGQSSEFRVEGIPAYDYRNGVRWLWSHSRQSPWVMLAALIGVELTALRNVGTPVLIGAAFAEVSSDDPIMGRAAPGCRWSDPRQRAGQSR